MAYDDAEAKDLPSCPRRNHETWIRRTLVILSILILSVLPVVGAWKIVSKAGFNGALSLLWLVPLVNVAAILVFAFSDWPVLRELSALRANLSPPPTEAFKRS